MTRNHDIMLDESPLRTIFMSQESLNRAKYSWSSAEFSCCPGSAEEEAAEVHAYSPVVVGVAVVFRRSIEWMMRVCRLMTRPEPQEVAGMVIGKDCAHISGLGLREFPSGPDGICSPSSSTRQRPQDRPSLDTGWKELVLPVMPSLQTLSQILGK